MEIITTHTNADFDTLASIIAAKKLYPDAVVVFPAGVEKAVGDFLEKYPPKDFEHVGANRINTDEVKRLILVDTRQRGRIGLFAKIIDRENLDIHIYDHHPPSDDDIEGSVEITSKCGSTTTIMVGLLREKELPVTPEEATVMMLGIYEDTGFLSFVSTTPEDYLAAAYLLSNGADLKIVSDMIKREMTAEQVALLNALNANAILLTLNGIDVCLTKAATEKFIGDAAALVHRMMDMNRIDVLFALIRMNGKIYLIARSRIKEADAGEIAVELGGGGHPTAASAVIKDSTLAEAEAKLLRALEEKIHGIRVAGDIMSAPVKTVDGAEPLKTTKEIMAKLNINVLPVLEEGKITGLISRQDIGKAIYHGLGEHETREFMTSDFLAVRPQDSLSRVQEAIIERNQKLLPVMEGDEIKGCITRTDILRILHQDAKKTEEIFEKKLYRRNLRGTIKGRLPGWLQDVLMTAGKKADEMSVRAYLVGGFVRDLILGNENLDVDIVVEGDGIAYAEKLAETFGGRCRGHKKFKTAVVILPDGFKIDVASARMEFYKTPAALPTVEAASIKMDLYRRDFTINSMAIKINRKGFGELLDYFGGLGDIREKVIRVLHSLSFIEDPTRAFRAVRFEERLGFHLGKQTLKLIKNAARLDFFDKVSSARIFGELKIILMEKEPLGALRRMETLDLLRFIHPAIAIDPEIEKRFGELEKVLGWYDLLFKKEKYDKWIIYLALLQERFGPAEVDEMTNKIGLSAKYREKIAEIKKKSGRMQEALSEKGLDDLHIYRILESLHIETLLFMMAVTGSVRIKERISHYITDLKGISVEIDGRDIADLGIMPGPLYTEIKNDLVNERLKGNIKSKSEELRHIRKKWLRHQKNG